ncbi:MAG: VTT domain-containing protein [Patescibacteria group bacterium]
MRKKHIFISLAVVLLLFSLVVVVILSRPSNIDAGIDFVGRHTVIGPLLLIVWRILGIVFPALPAGVISFAVVPIFGWLHTYIYTLSGILVGTSVAFFLARTFREKLVQRFMPLQKIHKLEGEISKKKQFLAIVALRLFTVPVMDFSSYIAGLTKISYKKFMLATLFASVPDIFIFYIGEEVYKKIFGKSVFVAVIALLTIASIYYIYKKYKPNKRNGLE